MKGNSREVADTAQEVVADGFLFSNRFKAMNNQKRAWPPSKITKITKSKKSKIKRYSSAPNNGGDISKSMRCSACESP